LGKAFANEYSYSHQWKNGEINTHQKKKKKEEMQAKSVSSSGYGYFQQHSFVDEIAKFSLKELESHSSCSTSLSSSNIRMHHMKQLKNVKRVGKQK
jgi:hypothetical protein